MLKVTIDGSTYDNNYKKIGKQEGEHEILSREDVIRAAEQSKQRMLKLLRGDKPKK